MFGQTGNEVAKFLVLFLFSLKASLKNHVVLTQNFGVIMRLTNQKQLILYFYFPGAAGLVLARELLNSGSETNVCIFEKENRLGGKIFDYRFTEAPNITVGKFPRQFLFFSLHLFDL